MSRKSIVIGLIFFFYGICCLRGNDHVLFDFSEEGSSDGWSVNIYKPNSKGEKGSALFESVSGKDGKKALKFYSKDAGTYKFCSPRIPEGGDWRKNKYDAIEVIYKGNGKNEKMTLILSAPRSEDDKKSVGSAQLFLGKTGWERESFNSFWRRPGVQRIDLSKLTRIFIKGSGNQSLTIQKITLIGGRKLIYMENSDLPQIVAPLLKSVPELDGLLNDDVWKKAVKVSDFKLKNGDKSKYPTEVFAFYNKNTLFVGARMSGEKTEDIKAVHKDYDSSVWKDSCLEVYLDPMDKNSNSEEYKFIINPLGTVQDLGKRSVSWNGKFKVVSKTIPTGGWLIELAIDLSVFGELPKPGDIWGFNVKRHVPAEKYGQFLDVSGWSQATPSPTSGLGTMIFGPESKEKINVTSIELRPDKNDDYVCRIIIGGVNKKLKVYPEFLITSPGNNAPSVKVYDGPSKALDLGENVFRLPFTWRIVKDGKHLAQLTFRDETHQVIFCKEFSFFLSRPVVCNLDDVILWPPAQKWVPQKNKHWILPKKIDISLKGNGDSFPAEHLAKMIKARYGINSGINTPGEKPEISLTYVGKNELKPESFSLDIGEYGVKLSASDSRGMYYAIRALLDIITQSSIGSNPTRAVYAHCEDWPAIPHRVFYFRMDDRFKVNKGVEVMKDLIYDQVAGGRFNLMILNMRGGYKYQSHPEISRYGSYFTKDELKAIIDFGRKHYVDMAPGGNSPGHASWLTKSHKELMEDGAAQVLYMKHPDTLPLLFDLYGELVDLFKPKYFHIGGDEVRWQTHLLPEEKHSPLSKGLEKRDILLEHWTAIAEFLKKKGVTPILWDDMLSEKWNGGGVYNVSKILEKMPKYIVMAHWGKGHNAVPPEKLKKLGFPKPWRISTSFSHVKVDNFLYRWKEYDGAGIAQFCSWPWSNFGHFNYAKACLYSTPAIHCSASCAWKPEVATQGYERMIANNGQHWSEVMEVPDWGTRQIAFNPLSISSACNSSTSYAKDGKHKGWMDISATHDLRNMPKGKLNVGAIPFVLSEGEMNCIVVSKDEKSEFIPVNKKILGLAFLQAAGADSTQIGLIQKFTRYKNRMDYYGITIAYCNVLYVDGNKVSIPMKMGWNIHLWDCLPRARVMPDIGAYWTGFTSAQEEKDPASPDASAWLMEWRNPYPEKMVQSINFSGGGHDFNTAIFGVSEVLVQPQIN